MRPGFTILVVQGDPAAQLSAMEGAVTVSLRSAPSIERQVMLRNVVGILPGSDAALRYTYVVLGAHYDHVGVGGAGEDRIYNGANDDASGVAVLLETAAALGSIKERPRRSVVFLCVFGEELGLYGSRYYARNPVFALEKTVGALTLEVLGRTDGEGGPHENRVSMTGHGYSTITDTLTAAGQQTGFTVYRHDPNSDAFFTRSDNAAFAEAGVPAHALSTGFGYPDYHEPGDHWEKLNFPHMEGVTRLVTLGMLMLADSVEPPAWNADNPRTLPFRVAPASAGRQAGAARQ
jgi:hypothetical protein